MSGREPRKCFSIFPFYYMPFNEMRKWKMEKGERETAGKKISRVRIHERVFSLIIYVNLWLGKYASATRHTLEVEGINFR
jgi:hypothetical protein